MLDRIELRGLALRGHHGVFDHERVNGQDFIVDITVWMDLSHAGHTDHLTQTYDYAHLVEKAAAVITGPPCNLIETLATRIADDIFLDERIGRLEVTVHKPHAPIPANFADVAVVIQRNRQ